MTAAGETLKGRLAAGEATTGTFVNMGSPVAVEICAIAGLDWLVIDLEHGTGHEAHLTGQLQAAAIAGTPALVRVESATRPRVGRALDQGAAGIMFPRLESAAEVRDAVALTRYSGERGVATYNRAGRFGTAPENVGTADGRVVVAIQIESMAAVDSAREIAEVEGVDVLFVGPADLSHSMGRFGQLDDPGFQAALVKVVEAADGAGKTPGLLVGTPGRLPEARSAGFRFVAVGSDSTMLMDAARATAAAGGQ